MTVAKMSGYWTELRTWILADPAKLIRYLVLFICCIIVIMQLSQCFSNLQNPPISTHSYYNLSESIEMPAITICREPPYKEDVLAEIFKQPYCYHPRMTSCWKTFPFGEIDLEAVFLNGTFNEEETFQRIGLNQEQENVEITSSIHFNMGRCHTIRPRILSKTVHRSSGYSMMLKHHVPKNESYKYEDVGWHIFVHDPRENFTEIKMKGSGRVEYIFAEIDEQIEIKLQMQYFAIVETTDKLCSRISGYSDSKCGERCIWSDLVKKSNCAGPWMSDMKEKPCEEAKSMKNLTVGYNLVYDNEDDPECDCIESCESRIFSTSVQNRRAFTQPDHSTTQVWIYYNSKLISINEERPCYDMSQFIADVGGSLGFLLGLSVLGLIGILEHIILFFCGSFIKSVQLKSEQRTRDQAEAERQSNQSDTTVEISTIYKNKKHFYTE